MQVAGENESYVTEFVLTGCSGQRKHKMEIVSALIIVYILTVVGNSLIVLVIICDVRLHSPMYFFICNLSIVDMCLITLEIPQSVANCLMDRPVTPFGLCATQIIVGVFFGATECLLLVVMAYDRYVAISNPLHYVLVINRTVCIRLAAFSWTAAFLMVAIPCFSLPIKFCGQNKVDHIMCEFKAVFFLICNNVALYQIGIYLIAGAILLVPLSFILFSYVRIVIAILRMHSGNRQKAFSTCISHLAVVSLYFGAAIFAFLLPQSKEGTHLNERIASGFATVLTPMCNPFIYSLKNKEISGALKRMIYKREDM